MKKHIHNDTRNPWWGHLLYYHLLHQEPCPKNTQQTNEHLNWLNTLTDPETREKLRTEPKYHTYPENEEDYPRGGLAPEE